MLGYLLGFMYEGELLWLPPRTGRSKRYDGCFDDKPYFELRPKFEPPRVPYAMLYRVKFVGASGFIEEPPYALSGGLYVPIGTPMVLPGKKNIARRRPRKMY